jgi:hypothetical protein
MPLVGALALGTLAVGCGSSTDPDAVGLDELKFASGLKVVDQGGGTVRLMWNGVNNEDDFSGYNVYGVKNSADVAKLEGSSIELLDDKGEPTADGKATLQLMNFNGTDFETAGAANDAAGDLQVVPYYAKAEGEDPVLPSCIPAENAGDGVECKTTDAEGAKGTFNGLTWFDVTGLKVDGQYCFTVLPTLDSGKKVAMTTSEVRCVYPRSKMAIDGMTDKTKTLALDFKAIRAACGADGKGCEGDVIDISTDGGIALTDTRAISCGVTYKADGSVDKATVQALCLEHFSGKPNFTAGKNTGVQDLGWYPGGFNDATVPAVPALGSFSNLQNKDGYSVAGQSLPIEDEHIYAIAHGEEGTDSFYYHLIYVSGLEKSEEASEFKMDVRVAGKADAL